MPDGSDGFRGGIRPHREGRIKVLSDSGCLPLDSTAVDLLPNSNSLDSRADLRLNSAQVPVMKVSAAAILSLVGLVSVEGGWAGSEGNYERTLYAASFDSVDWSGLAAVAGVSLDGDLAARQAYERNLKYIFHHKLNRRRFLVAPDPQMVVDRIVAIMETNQRIARLLADGRMQLGGRTPETGAQALVREVGHAARTLKEQFTGFFLEAHSATYAIHLPRSPDPAAQFSNFILQAQTISRDLTRRLDDYFFTSSPGAVRLEEMRSGNIVTLAESLEVLAGAVNRGLK